LEKVLIINYVKVKSYLSELESLVSMNNIFFNILIKKYKYISKEHKIIILYKIIDQLYNCIQPYQTHCLAGLQLSGFEITTCVNGAITTKGNNYSSSQAEPVQNPTDIACKFFV